MIRLILFLLAGILTSSRAETQVYSQLYTGRQEMFLEAESYLLFEEFNEALPLYLELIREQPDNAFLNYRTGITYLNIPGEKELAIEYLEKATTDMDSRDRRPSYRTTKAPVDALFYLGNAYHINYQFDKALEKYERFKEVLNPSVYNKEIVLEHIKASKNAMESIRNPVLFIEENLGERINTRFSETNPVVSGNRKVLVFSRSMQFYDGVFLSRNNDEGEWSWPVDITQQLGSDGDCYPVSISYDGTELYLYKSDNLVGNIYVSHLVDNQWTGIKKLNENINTGYWESHASISGDGNTLYFTSNRPGGFGGLDIYYSQRDNRGEWGPAVNLGPVINTPFNEETPFVSENGSTLFFSSYGHHNIGGYDIFYSKRSDDGNWSIPENMGYGVNTPDDDLFFHPLKGGIYAYVSKFDDEGFGEADIFRYEFFSDLNPRKFLLKGLMQRNDGLQTGIRASITVIDPSTGDTIKTARPNQITGEYEVELEHGEWEIVFMEEGQQKTTRLLNLPPDRKDQEIIMDTRLERKEPEIPGINDVITDRIILPAEPMTDHSPEIRPLTADDTISQVYPDSTPEILTREKEISRTPFQEDTDDDTDGEEISRTPFQEDTDDDTDGEEISPQEEVDVTPGGKAVPMWWILIVIVLILSAYYLIKRNAGKQSRSQ